MCVLSKDSHSDEDLLEKKTKKVIGYETLKLETPDFSKTQQQNNNEILNLGYSLEEPGIT